MFGHKTIILVAMSLTVASPIHAENIRVFGVRAGPHRRRREPLSRQVQT
jgi:hypothetical protein